MTVCLSLKEDTNKNKVHYKMEKTGAKIREIKMEKGTKKIYLHRYLLQFVLFICDYHEGSLFSADFVACMSSKILLMMVMMKCFIPIKHSAWCNPCLYTRPWFLDLCLTYICWNEPQGVPYMFSSLLQRQSSFTLCSFNWVSWEMIGLSALRQRKSVDN